MPAVKFFARLDLDPICLFLDGHYLNRYRNRDRYRDRNDVGLEHEKLGYCGCAQFDSAFYFDFDSGPDLDSDPDSDPNCDFDGDFDFDEI
jgi:hypothetical protein